MGYGKEHPYEEIHHWEDDIPFDEWGHALDITELSEDKKSARVLTSPYGILNYGVGNGDYFFVFDYAQLPNGKIALHSVVNCESAGFIQDGDYAIVEKDEAYAYAKNMFDEAMSACIENDVPNKGWGKTAYEFLRCVRELTDEKYNKERTRRRRYEFKKKYGYTL